MKRRRFYWGQAEQQARSRRVHWWAAVILTGLASSVQGGSVDVEARFANDLGPQTVDVREYPEIMKTRYRLFARKCAACHSLARPINSQFVEGDPAALGIPSNARDIWNADPEIWKRYIKRMSDKPGSTIAPSEAKDIHAFLVYDSRIRKTGSRADPWNKDRRRWLADFQAKYPQRYAELYGRAPVVKETRRQKARDVPGNQQ